MIFSFLGRPKIDYGLNMLNAQVMSQQAALDFAMRQCVSSINDYNALLNYRPTAFVPQGWQDWYAIGDQLQ